MPIHSDSVHLIEGIEVKFPYPPYKSQTSYMKSVIAAVKGGKNALIESPTGTGKTLSLICSSIACLWNDKYSEKSVFKLDSNTSNSATLESSLLNKISELRKPINNDSKGFKSRNGDRMHIIYASRTHTQLRQVVREAKKSSYSKEFALRGIKVALLGSRDQMCINPARKNLTGEALNVLCRNMVKDRKCSYYNGYKMAKTSEDISFYELMDIEDLVSLCKYKKCCPYYVAKDAHELADLTLLPYNYLLSPTIRESMELNLQGAILIIDEAHNIESLAEGAASFHIRQVDIARYMATLRRFAQYHKDYLISMSSKDNESVVPIDIGALTILANSLKKIDDFLTNITLNEYDETYTATESADSSWIVKEIRRKHLIFKAKTIIYRLMNDFDLGSLRKIQIDEVIKHSISAFYTGLSNSNQLDDLFVSQYNTKIIQEDIQSLESLRIMLYHIFSREILTCPEYFHVLITNDERFNNVKTVTSNNPSSSGWNSKMNKKSTSSADSIISNQSTNVMPKIMVFECLQAIPTFLRLKDEGVRSIILTSGTLAPLDLLEKQIGGNKLPFEVKLQNKHVINPSRIWAGIITGHKNDSNILTSTYSTRMTTPYVMALGKSLLSFIKNVPMGVLVFFSSYPVMEQTVSMWKQFGLYSEMEMVKSIFIESKSSVINSSSAYQDYNKFDNSYGYIQTQIMEYRSHIAKGKGSVFIGICRGKIAEGIDFSDDYCRGVFMCGIPYPNRYDTNTALKMDYLRANVNNFGSNDGADIASDWYVTQAIRAINQAIGRSIRHINDYGAILLADSRYQSSAIRQNISSWISNNIQVYQSIDDSINDLTYFFKRMSSDAELDKSPIPAVYRNIYAMNDIKSPTDTELLNFKSRKTTHGHNPKSMPLSIRRLHTETKQRSDNVKRCIKIEFDDGSSPEKRLSQSSGDNDTSWASSDKWSYTEKILPLNISKSDSSK